jgi:lysophospholipase L1-like esterase
MRIRAYVPVVAALTLVAGCRSDESLNAPDLSNNDGMFRRYVAMGNSITAGFQSGGINDSTQLEAYPVLVAAAAKASFFPPLLTWPGCPPPIAVNTTAPPTRVGGGGPTDCALREGRPLPYVSNVAVPGVTSFGVVDNASPAGGTNPLTQFILGGRTQVRAMVDAQPTFVSVWIGNNDVLASLTDPTNPGDPALLTPVAAFEANYAEVLDSVVKLGARAVLVAVGDVTTIPYASSGATYWCLKTGACPGIPAGGFPAGFTVADDCAPLASGLAGASGDSVLVPWTVGVAKLTAAAGGASATLECAADAEVVLAAEFATMRAAVAGYNAFIRAQAAQHGWAYLDLNPALLAIKQADLAAPSPGQFPRIASFPCLPGAACGAGGAVNTTANVLFGTYFSLDGVHPSGLAHRAIADSLISAVNAAYGTTIPYVGP